MRTYKVAIVNTILNFRKFLIIKGYSCADAGAEARKQMHKLGYDKLESITCIG